MSREPRLVFGEVAELYDRARPTYPAALIDHVVGLVAPAGTDRTPRVLDVGCGTGKATVLLAARGLSGVGLEPDADMAAVARRNLAPFPHWSVTMGEFEDYPTAAATPPAPFDLITCAQAWHWLDPDRRFQQAARLLRPGGWLALFWNRTGDDASPVRREVDRVYGELFPGLSPHGTLTAGRPPVGAPPREAGFEAPGAEPAPGPGPAAEPAPGSPWQVFPWVRRYTTKEWTDQVQTHSDHRMLEANQRAILVARLSVAIDAYGGVYDHPYNCWLWTAQRL